MRDFNKDMVDSYEQGLLSPEALMESLEPLPQIVPRPSKTWCSEFRLNWGWSMLTRGFFGCAMVRVLTPRHAIISRAVCQDAGLCQPVADLEL